MAKDGENWQSAVQRGISRCVACSGESHLTVCGNVNFLRKTLVRGVSYFVNVSVLLTADKTHTHTHTHTHHTSLPSDSLTRGPDLHFLQHAN